MLLVTLNGTLTSQIRAGHYVWVGYLMLPVVALALLQLVETPPSWRHAGWLALELGVTIYQGSYHFYMWGVMLLVLIVLFSVRYKRHVLGTILFGAPHVAFRAAPAALTFWGSRRGFYF